MSHESPTDDAHDDAPPPDPRWEALARQLAGEATADDLATTTAWLAADRDEGRAILELDRGLDHLAFTPSSDVDVERALQRVRAQLAAEGSMSSATPTAAPTTLAIPTPLATPLAAEPPATAAPTLTLVRPDAPTATGAAARGAAADDARAVPFRPVRTKAPVRAAPTRRTAWRIAAAIAVVAGGTYALTQALDRGAPAQHFATAVGQRDSVQLADGTRIVLGPGSTLDVVAGYGDGRREVALQGEASFQVTHDAERPFVVRAGAATIEDVGTAFVVRAGGEGRVSVAVTEGTVIVRPASSATGDSVVMHAGDRGAVVDGHAMLAATRLDATDEATGWTQGRLVFQDASIGDVAAGLRRWYGIELRADPALAARTLTATFAGESAAEALRVVSLALGATIEQRGDTVLAHQPP